MNQQHVKDSVKQLLIEWDRLRPDLEAAYASHTPERLDLLQSAIEPLEQLIERSGMEENKFTGKMHFVLEPNNYTERLDFIKLQNTSHYALIQLTMLYEEVKKKAARLRVQK
ncbi:MULTISPECIES: YpoC family protein [Sporosarcina]|uniref:YpoC family protein n=1 Tax=Sporosarcina TaxID=1569 RepID=UPI00129A2248|nr:MULTISPECIES: hypothetical protein [Sporosarcina]GKV67167.1 hypothetical protein NCCP2331_33200 [Sporosarcina sp. NCCP-2331]GLB57493.1 hypothetical protein NCCP2378_32810 [Sporosarcina sp. NCCP-2378]